MKCLYFLVPTLASTNEVSNDLHAVGIEDFYLHIICSDESGLKRHRLHAGNYIETLNVLRDGFIGAVLGLIAGGAGVGLLMYFQPLGPNVQVPTWAYAALVAAATLFGAWEGGLIGIAAENKKLKRFHDDIAAGRYLALIYVRKHQEAIVRKMMEDRHPEAEMVGIDSHFVNPFGKVARTQRGLGSAALNP